MGLNLSSFGKGVYTEVRIVCVGQVHPHKVCSVHSFLICTLRHWLAKLTSSAHTLSSGGVEAGPPQKLSCEYSLNILSFRLGVSSGHPGKDLSG